MDGAKDSRPSSDRRNICCCGRNECPEITAVLAAANHPMKGAYSYKTAETKKKAAFQRVLATNLCPPGIKLTGTECQISWYHHNTDAIDYFAGNDSCPYSKRRDRLLRWQR